jgi:uncharacterized membrane protein YoaK (UPF0700 family)
VTTNRNQQAIDARVRNLLLYTLTISSGSVDAISWFALGGVFSAAMTGNMALLGLRIAGARTLAPIFVAIGAFVVGVYLAVQIVKRSGDSGTWPRGVTLALSLALIPHAVFIAVWSANHSVPSSDCDSRRPRQTRAVVSRDATQTWKCLRRLALGLT